MPGGWLHVLDAQDGDRRPGRRWCTPTTRSCAGWRCFDVVVNNADRKGGHVLDDEPTATWYGVDHGLTFNVDDKLRTVLWGWAGRPLDRGPSRS